MVDIILKKRRGHPLSEEDIRFAVAGYTQGAIPDYQMSALLMAVFFQGMTDEETSILTDCMAHSGEMIDLSAIDGIVADKHSTGGVGDKTTLVVAPIVAACGVKVAKMTGRGLGHTGGTADKLESISGFRLSLSRDEFFKNVREIGLSIVSQTGDLAPADKKLYALRDVTATVDSIPLIAASIMSKKLAAGAGCIVLDVKMGSGAFMKTLDDAEALARRMVGIGEKAGRRTAALITNMDAPLGNAVGNSLEVIEAVETLNGRGPDDLTDLCAALAANMLLLAGMGTYERCEEMATTAIESGEALKKLIRMVSAQGGDADMLLDTGRFDRASVCYPVRAERDGFIAAMDTESCGVAAALLGAGRAVKNAKIDHSAGILLHKKTGDLVHVGDPIASLCTNSREALPTAAELYRDAVTISGEKPEKKPLIYALVDREGVHPF